MSPPAKGRGERGGCRCIAVRHTGTGAALVGASPFSQADPALRPLASIAASSSPSYCPIPPLPDSLSSMLPPSSRLLSLTPQDGTVRLLPLVVR